MFFIYKQKILHELNTLKFSRITTIEVEEGCAIFLFCLEFYQFAISENHTPLSEPVSCI